MCTANSTANTLSDPSWQQRAHQWVGSGGDHSSSPSLPPALSSTLNETHQTQCTSQHTTQHLWLATNWPHPLCTIHGFTLDRCQNVYGRAAIQHFVFVIQGGMDTGGGGGERGIPIVHNSSATPKHSCSLTLRPAVVIGGHLQRIPPQALPVSLTPSLH